ncbi:MAG TPA: hypothetical protein VFN97_22915 [Actinospica sp.]|nr:hypothetical protein [Actinospica sp.]
MTMRRASFIGALTALGCGAVLTFAVQTTWRSFDMRTAGVIVMLGALADLLIRVLIADSPLLSPQSADIAALVEPLGEPLLDANGRPVIVENPAAKPRPPRVDPPTAVIGGARYPMVSPITESADRDASAQRRRFDTPESPVAVTTLAGRPVHPRGRGFIGSRTAPSAARRGRRR